MKTGRTDSYTGLPETAIQLTDASFTHIGSEEPVLRGASLTIPTGSMVAVVGDNGSGKTTLSLILAGVIPRFLTGRLSGHVTVFGENLAQADSALVSSLIAYVPQEPRDIFLGATVREELSMASTGRLNITNWSISEAAEVADLATLFDRAPTDLSAGEKQRLAIAIAAMRGAPLLLLDEPFEGLDPVQRCRMVNMVNEMRRRGCTTLVFACTVPSCLGFDRVLRLADGEIRHQDTNGPQPPVKAPPFRRPLVPRNATAAPGGPVLSAHELTCAYPRALHAALRNVDLELDQGELLGIVGSNGAGKSALILSLAGLLRPIRGACYFRTTRLDRLTPPALAQRAGVIFQTPDHQIFATTMREELEFGLRNIGVSRNEATDRINRVRSLFRLAHLMRDPRTLSYGQRRLLTWACVVAIAPDVYLVDEPDHGMSVSSRDLVYECVASLLRAGKTVLVASHSIGPLIQGADRIALMRDGSVVGVGPPQEMLPRAEKEIAAQTNCSP